MDIKNFFEGYSESDVTGFADSKQEMAMSEQNLTNFSITQINGFSPDDKQILTLVKAFCKIESYDIRVKILDLLKVISVNENIGCDIEKNTDEDKQ